MEGAGRQGGRRCVVPRVLFFADTASCVLVLQQRSRQRPSLSGAVECRATGMARRPLYCSPEHLALVAKPPKCYALSCPPRLSGERYRGGC